MTQDEVIKLWKDANNWDVRSYTNTLEDLERFAHLVAKHTLSNIDPSKFMSCQEVMEAARLAERQRIVNLLMIQHEAAKDSHNYWHVAANLIQAETGEQT